MNQTGRSRYAVGIKGDLTFEVQEDEDGEFIVVGGSYDFRGSDNIATVAVYAIGSYERIHGDLADLIIDSIPTRGEL